MINKLGFGSLKKKTSRDIYGEFLESKHYGFYTAGSTLMILGGIYYLPGSQCHYRIVEFANDTSLVFIQPVYHSNQYGPVKIATLSELILSIPLTIDSNFEGVDVNWLDAQRKFQVIRSILTMDESIEHVCNATGVPRKVLADWCERYKAAGYSIKGLIKTDSEASREEIYQKSHYYSLLAYADESTKTLLNEGQIYFFNEQDSKNVVDLTYRERVWELMVNLICLDKHNDQRSCVPNVLIYSHNSKEMSDIIHDFNRVFELTAHSNTRNNLVIPAIELPLFTLPKEIIAEYLCTTILDEINIFIDKEVRHHLPSLLDKVEYYLNLHDVKVITLRCDAMLLSDYNEIIMFIKTIVNIQTKTKARFIIHGRTQVLKLFADSSYSDHFVSLNFSKYQ